MNKQWHEAHKLAKNAGLEERLVWHVAHAEACGCRPIPLQIQHELDKPQAPRLCSLRFARVGLNARWV